MTDTTTWQLAVAAVTKEFSRLSPGERDRFSSLAEEVWSSKTALHAIAAAADCGGICTDCGGECCRTGKYHFTLVDLLVYLSRGEDLFEPGFNRPHCPYLGPEGCFMTPGYRPYTCVTFNCDRVMAFLEPSDEERLVRLERELRGLYGRFGVLLGRRVMDGLLLDCEAAKGADLMRGQRAGNR
jgi:hypothetical protein